MGMIRTIPNKILSLGEGHNWSIGSSADLSRIIIASQTGSSLTGASSDGGINFAMSKTPDFPDSAFRDVLLIDNNTALLAGIGDFIYRTTNFGRTWTSIAATGQRNWGGFAMSDDTNKILAYSSTASFLSTDQGATWTVRTNNAPGGQGYQYAASSAGFTLFGIDAGTGTILSKSVDDGQSWTALSNQPTVLAYWQGLHVSSDGLTICLGGVNCDFARSTDGGSTWNYRTMENTTLNVFNRRAPGQSGNTLILSGNYNLNKSLDGGATWFKDPLFDNAYWTINNTSPYHVYLSSDGVTMVTGTEYFNQHLIVRRA